MTSGYGIRRSAAKLSTGIGTEGPSGSPCGCRTVAGGGNAMDPEVVSQLLARRDRDEQLGRLTPREREVLALMGEGRTNTAIAGTLVIGTGAVEKNVTSIFQKLGLDDSGTDHRRVLAVLAWLQR